MKNENKSGNILFRKAVSVVKSMFVNRDIRRNVIAALICILLEAIGAFVYYQWTKIGETEITIRNSIGRALIAPYKNGEPYGKSSHFYPDLYTIHIPLNFGGLDSNAHDYCGRLYSHESQKRFKINRYLSYEKYYPKDSWDTICAIRNYKNTDTSIILSKDNFRTKWDIIIKTTPKYFSSMNYDTKIDTILKQLKTISTTDSIIDSLRLVANIRYVRKGFRWDSLKGEYNFSYRLHAHFADSTAKVLDNIKDSAEIKRITSYSGIYPSEEINFEYPSISEFPKWYRVEDLSRRLITIRLEKAAISLDSASLNKITLNFFGPYKIVSADRMPDRMYLSSISFDGLNNFGRNSLFLEFPYVERIQEARILALTTLMISVLLTLIVNCFVAVGKIVRRENKMKQIRTDAVPCYGSFSDCSECSMYEVCTFRPTISRGHYRTHRKPYPNKQEEQNNSSE